MEWIDDPGARRKLETLDLTARDRFLIDLLYYTGIRVGEALSLFSGDMHFGGGSPELGCRTVDPHFHVVMGHPTENGARSKGAERTLHVTPLLVERYVDYVLERSAVLGLEDHSKHVFVNLYDRENDYLGRAMTYSNAYDLVRRMGDKIGIPSRVPICSVTPSPPGWCAASTVTGRTWTSSSICWDTEALNQPESIHTGLNRRPRLPWPHLSRVPSS